MGKDKKKGAKANIFKVAGAKSLKKSKAKAVNLGLKNIKQKVKDIDAEFLEISKTPKPTPVVIKTDNKVKKPHQTKKGVSKEEIAQAAKEITKMDL